MPEITSYAPIGYLVVLALTAPGAFMLGRRYKRQRGESFTRKQHWMHLAIASAVFLILMVIAGLASADQKPPLLVSVARARMFEAALAITGPQHKQGNVLNVYVWAAR